MPGRRGRGAGLIFVKRRAADHGDHPSISKR